MVDRDDVRSSYDELAGTYADHRSDNPPAVAFMADLLADLPDDARVLDAGCGQGEPVLSAVGDGVERTGLDFSREQLVRARRTVPGAGLVQGDLTDLPFADGTFDAVLSFWSLIHLTETDTRDATAEFARVLRPGGHLVVNEGVDEWTGRNPDWLDTGVEMQWHLSGEAALREHLQRAGFSITDTWYGYDTLEDDAPDGEDDADEDDDADPPWVYLQATVDGED